LADSIDSGATNDTTSDRELRADAGEEGVDLASALATLVDTPDNERLSAAAVTSSVHSGNVGAVVAGGSLDVLAGVTLNFLTEETVLRAKETHGEEDKVGREELLTAFDSLHIPSTSSALGPLNTDSVDALHAATAIIDKLLGHDAEFTGVLAHVGLDFGVTIVDTVDTGPLGPWVVAGTLWGRLGQQLEVDDRLGTVADGGTNAVVTGITTTNDDNVLVLGGDVRTVSQLGVEERLGVLVQELHGEVDALELTAGNLEVTSDSRTGGKDNSIIVGAERLEGSFAVRANGGSSDELDTLSGH
jgi:hypothetical protein